MTLQYHELVKLIIILATVIPSRQVSCDVKRESYFPPSVNSSRYEPILDEHDSATLFEMVEAGSKRLCDIHFDGVEKFHGRLTNGEIIYLSMWTKYQSNFRTDLKIHEYDKKDELLLSGGPKVDHERCLVQLEDLNSRLDTMKEEKLRSRDVNLYQLLDTFGREPAGRLLGNPVWIGQHDECLRLKIVPSNGGQPLGTRFCWAKFRHRDWPQPTDETIKAGVCLPKFCDSTNYKTKYQLIKSLMSYQMQKSFDYEELELHDLYCLPDEESSLRAWPVASKVTAALLIGWFLLVLYSTYKFECVAGSSPVFQWLAITSNLRNLFSTFRSQRGEAKLEVIDGVKILAFAHIVTIHTLIMANSLYSNEFEIGNMKNPLYYVNFMMPTFAVTMFMSVSGILIGYSMMKRQDRKPFMHKPIEWMHQIVHRYLRLVVILIVLTGFIKYLIKYSGSGPLWDYATTEKSPMRICEHELWSSTLLLIQNLRAKRPDLTCVPSSWYLSIDFQFFLATPVFLYALQRSPKFGKLLTVGCIALCSLNTSLNIYQVGQKVDLRPISGFKKHGFQLYFEELMVTYLQAVHRIPAYLWGILFGYLMFEHEKVILKRSKVDKDDDKCTKSSGSCDARLPYGLDRFGAYYCLLCLSYYLAAPYIASSISFTRRQAAISVSIFVPTCHLVSSLMVSIYIFLAAFGRGSRLFNKFLCIPLWQPLTRVALSLLVSHFCWLYISTLSSSHLEAVSGLYLLRSYMFHTIISYMIAIGIYVVYEEPGRIITCIIWNATKRRIEALIG